MTEHGKVIPEWVFRGKLRYHETMKARVKRRKENAYYTIHKQEKPEPEYDTQVIIVNFQTGERYLREGAKKDD